jgi:hypothetical protein
MCERSTNGWPISAATSVRLHGSSISWPSNWTSSSPLH